MIKPACKNCDCYQQLYSKIPFRFFKEKYGYCTMRKYGIKESELCPKWRNKQPRKINAAARLNEAADDVKYIIEFYKRNS